MESLNAYLAQTCYTLLNVGKDLFYKELHSPLNQSTLRSFATDKKLRTLVVARIDNKPSEGANEETKADESNNGAKEEILDESQIEIIFTVKV